MPGTYRSDHYSHSVAARGRGAARFVADHRRNEGLRSPWDRAPWGATYGIHSPMMRAYEQDGKLLMLGVDYDTSTFIHVVEAIFWRRRAEAVPDAVYIGLNRPKLGEFWERQGRLNHGTVGDASCRCFRIRDYVDTLLGEVIRGPTRYVAVS